MSSALPSAEGGPEGERGVTVRQRVVPLSGVLSEPCSQHRLTGSDTNPILQVTILPEGNPPVAHTVRAQLCPPITLRLRGLISTNTYEVELGREHLGQWGNESPLLWQAAAEAAATATKAKVFVL